MDNGIGFALTSSIKPPTRRPSCAPAKDRTKNSCSRGNHPALPFIRALSFLWPWGCPSHPWGPHSVLSNSEVSSVECQRLRTCYLGLPLVHPPPSWGPVASHSQTHTGVTCKACSSPSVHLPRARELWRDAGFLPLPSSPHTHCPTWQHPCPSQYSAGLCEEWF